MRPGGRLAGAVATAVTLACHPAAAQEPVAFYTGNELWSHCSDESAYSSGLCMGFVMGIADVMGAGSAILGARVCLPERVNGGETRDVVKRYLELHPERRHYAAASLVLDALAQAFPCKP
jgi:hypothetical protein